MTPSNGLGSVRAVALDLAGSGVRLRPGDRVQVHAENDDRQVGRTLGVLGAQDSQPVPLTPLWQAALSTQASQARLEQVLRLAQLRPAAPDFARALLQLTADATLRDVVRSRTEAGWEVWDLLELVAASGFDPSRLWRAQREEPESLCRFLLPAAHRTYSAASSPAATPDELHLTVARVEYETGQLGSADGHRRRGTASFFLTRPPAALGETDQVAVAVERPARFRLPPDPRTPLVLIGGGTGVSPFRGFLQERALQPDGGPVWLLLSARTSRDVCYRDELAALAADGRLEVRVGLTRQGDAEGLDGLPGRPGGVADLVLDETDGPVLWQLLRDGPAARVYVCGNAGFAASVAEAVRTLVRRHAQSAPHPDPGAAMVRRLIAEGRYVEELYTTHLDPERTPQRVLDVSELVLHNAGPGGVWTAIAGRVYDISEFVHEHPGGTALLQGYAGMDATHAFEQVGHHQRPDVAAHLPRYEVGALRRLNLGREWGVALTASGLRTVDLDEAHAAWVDLLYLAVEMQNAFRNDLSLRHRRTSRGSEALADLYSLQFAVETHARFLAECVPALTGDAISALWALTAGVCAPGEDVRRLPRLLEAVRTSACAEEALSSPTVLMDRLERLVDAEDVAAVDRLAALCRRLHARDAQFLDDVKLAVRGGVRVFEELQPDTVRRGATRLVAAALETVGLLQDYCADVAAELQPASA